MTDVNPPIAMLAELTHRCPLSCPYCSNPLELARQETEIDTGTWCDVFRQAADMGVLQLHLSGGEPASRRDLVPLVEAARTMGATRGQILRTVILPLIVPYMISGYAFAFVLSLNEYIIAYMVAGFTVETLPIKIFNSLRYGYTPIMGVVSVLFIALAVLVFGLIGRFGNLPRLLGAERIGE